MDIITENIPSQSEYPATTKEKGKHNTQTKHFNHWHSKYLTACTKAQTVDMFGHDVL